MNFSFVDSLETFKLIAEDIMLEALLFSRLEQRNGNESVAFPNISLLEEDICDADCWFTSYA